MEGYNVALMVDRKTLVGRTQDDMNIAARTKDSLTKDDRGNSNETVTGHDVTFRAAGLMDNTKPEVSQALTRDEIIELSLKKGDAAKIPVRYAVESGAVYGGTGIITGYSESTAANGDATYGLDIKISGEFAKIVPEENDEE